MNLITQYGLHLLVLVLGLEGHLVRGCVTVVLVHGCDCQEATEATQGRLTGTADALNALNTGLTGLTHNLLSLGQPGGGCCLPRQLCR